MNSNIALIFYTLDDLGPRVPREQVRQWAEELGMPAGPLNRRGRGVRFKVACTATVHEFVGADGAAAFIRAGTCETKAEEFISFVVLGPSGRVAQIRYVFPRRNAAGVVASSRSVKTIIRKDLPPVEEQAVTAWLEAVQEAFDQAHADVLWGQFRRVVRAAVVQYATPIHRRGSMFFCYSDQLARARATAEFLRRCAPTWEVAIFPLADGEGDLNVLAASADAFVLGDVLALQDRIEEWMAGSKDDPKRALFSLALKQWRGEARVIEATAAKHEAHLGHLLCDTLAGLVVAEEMIQVVDPTAHLLTVTRR